MLVCALPCASIAHETAGAARTRSSLRPLFEEGANDLANLGQKPVARTTTHTSSSPRTRGPIRRVVSLYAVRPMPSPTITARGYGSPRPVRNCALGGDDQTN